MAAAQKRGQSELWAIGILWAAGVLCLICGTIVAAAQNGEFAEGVRTLSAAQIITKIGAILLVAALAVTCLSILAHFHRMQAGREATLSTLRRLLAGQTQTEAILTQINENLLLSDAVKSVAFRDKDRAAIQDAIHQDIRREKWESAGLLADELEKRFGRREAEILRQELADYRNATIQDKLDNAIAHIDSLWMIHHYDEAEQEVQTLLKLHPNETKVQGLQGQSEKRRQEHKASLLARWDEALKANDVDQGIDLLKMLDDHLTPTEAAALKESARGVFKAKLHQMGVQFSLLITEKKWSQSLNLGRVIIEEFPNSRMAEEVRSKLDILTQRAQKE